MTKMTGARVLLECLKRQGGVYFWISWSRDSRST